MQYLSIRLRFIQIRKFPLALKNTIGKILDKKEANAGSMTPFQAVCTAVAMCCFAFSTIIGWGLYGARCIEFIFSSKVVKPFMVVYSMVAIVGATIDLGLVWDISDTCNGLMVIPNLTAVFLLSGTVIRLVKEYFAERREE